MGLLMKISVITVVLVHLLRFNFIAEIFIELFANIFGGMLVEIISWVFHKIVAAIKWVIQLVIWGISKLLGQ